MGMGQRKTWSADGVASDAGHAVSARPGDGDGTAAHGATGMGDATPPGAGCCSLCPNRCRAGRGAAHASLAESFGMGCDCFM
ncbi:MAG: hypothetical protein LBT74_02635 [Acidobacteriota bacterium]|jgi:hypothetical protein|nr:hypothetical protein [Acidobacteriota bacterium]